MSIAHPITPVGSRKSRGNLRLQPFWIIFLISVGLFDLPEFVDLQERSIGGGRQNAGSSESFACQLQADSKKEQSRYSANSLRIFKIANGRRRQAPVGNLQNS